MFSLKNTYILKFYYYVVKENIYTMYGFVLLSVQTMHIQYGTGNFLKFLQPDTNPEHLAYVRGSKPSVATC